MADKVADTAAANTTAAAKRQYGKGETANRALKASATRAAKATGRGRRVAPAVAAPAAARGAAPTAAELADAGYARPSGVDHSASALDSPPQEAMPEVRKVADRKARGLAPEPEEGKRGKRKASRKRR